MPLFSRLLVSWFSADFLCLLHLTQCQNANRGGVWLGEMKTRQDNPGIYF